MHAKTIVLAECRDECRICARLTFRQNADRSIARARIEVESDG